MINIYVTIALYVKSFDDQICLEFSNLFLTKMIGHVRFLGRTYLT
jgi:hypothetical protein